MEESKLKAFGAVLRQYRYKKELTQDELSERVGVASPYISMLESGHKYPNLEMLLKLAEALDLRPGELLDAMQERWR